MKKVILGILGSAFLFATMEIALKTAGKSLDSVQMTFLRFFIGAIVLTPFAVVETRERMARPSDDERAMTHHKDNASRRGAARTLSQVLPLKDLGWLFLVGVMGISISMLAFQLGVERCNAASAAAIISITPLFAMVIGAIFTSEKMTKLKTLAFILGLVALFFLVRPWEVQPGNTPQGIALLLFEAVTFAAYTVMGKRIVGRIGIFTQTSISFYFGSLVLLVYMLIARRPVIAGVAENIWLVLYCGVIVTGLGYFYYFMGIKYSDAATGSLTFFIKPVIAPILAVILLHETILWNTVIGISILTAASIITLYDAKRHTVADANP